jgi:hypothetical protein
MQVRLSAAELDLGAARLAVSSSQTQDARTLARPSRRHVSFDAVAIAAIKTLALRLGFVDARTVRRQASLDP